MGGGAEVPGMQRDGFTEGLSIKTSFWLSYRKWQINCFCLSIFDLPLHNAQQKLLRDTALCSKAEQLVKKEMFFTAIASVSCNGI